MRWSTTTAALTLTAAVAGQQQPEDCSSGTVPAMAATAPRAAESHSTTSSVLQMPEVPSEPISNHATQEEIDQLKELQASMMS